uniref:hypothetical protein n=1 Tax=Bradyrhizobium liaoningense TaxID=43992 RepID=UPI000557240B
MEHRDAMIDFGVGLEHRAALGSVVRAVSDQVCRQLGDTDGDGVLIEPIDLELNLSSSERGQSDRIGELAPVVW